MAKVVITFEDGDDGTVHLECNFDPPVEKEDGDGTPAQTMAMTALEKVLAIIESQS